MRYIAAVVLAVVLSGCGEAIEGSPAPEPQKLDCDLIFPAPGAA